MAQDCIREGHQPLPTHRVTSSNPLSIYDEKDTEIDTQLKLLGMKHNSTGRFIAYGTFEMSKSDNGSFVSFINEQNPTRFINTQISSHSLDISWKTENVYFISNNLESDSVLLSKMNLRNGDIQKATQLSDSLVTASYSLVYGDYDNVVYFSGSKMRLSDVQNYV